jgi:hypothetical protein
MCIPEVMYAWELTVTREMVSLEGYKKKLCEYLTFPDGTENEHIVIGRVIGGAGLKWRLRQSVKLFNFLLTKIY